MKPLYKFGELSGILQEKRKDWDRTTGRWMRNDKFKVVSSNGSILNSAPTKKKAMEIADKLKTAAKDENKGQFSLSFFNPYFGDREWDVMWDAQKKTPEKITVGKFDSKDYAFFQKKADKISHKPQW
tara:strand:+ start:1993 stop:2373 length:381 start_codon:yes stop_codon:yes gene_type:complete